MIEVAFDPGVPQPIWAGRDFPVPLTELHERWPDDPAVAYDAEYDMLPHWKARCRLCGAAVQRPREHSLDVHGGQPVGVIVLLFGKALALVFDAGGYVRAEKAR